MIHSVKKSKRSKNIVRRFDIYKTIFMHKKYVIQLVWTLK